MTPLTDAELEGSARNLVQLITLPRCNVNQATVVQELCRLRRCDFEGYIRLLDRYIRLVLKTAGVVVPPKIEALLRGEPVKFLDVEIPFAALPAGLYKRFEISEPNTTAMVQIDVDELEHEHRFAEYIRKIVTPLIVRYGPRPAGEPIPPTPCEIGVFVRREAFLVEAHAWARELVPVETGTQPVFSV